GSVRHWSAVAWPWSYLLWLPREFGRSVVRGGRGWARAYGSRPALSSVRYAPSGLRTRSRCESAEGTERTCAGCATGGFAPRHGHTSSSVVPSGGMSPLCGGFGLMSPAHPTGATGASPEGTVQPMDLAYPPEAE